MDSLFVVAHLVAGAILAVIAPVMQLAVGPGLKKIPGSPEKEVGVAHLKKRVQRTQDLVIVVMLVTVAYLLHSRWEMIAGNHLLETKILFGGAALLVASFMHFFYRAKKERVKASGDMERFKKMNALSQKLEKVVLVGAPTAFLLGVWFGHGF